MVFFLDFSNCKKNVYNQLYTEEIPHPVFVEKSKSGIIFGVRPLEKKVRLIFRFSV